MKRTKARTLIVLAIALALVAAIAWACYLCFVRGLGWADWTGFGEHVDSTGECHPAKTLWDWMDLLVVPLTLALVAFLLNRWQRQGEHNTTVDNQRQSMLESYFERMTDLILEHDLMGTPEVGVIGRTHTLALLMRLDKGRKGEVLQFLYEAGLISKSATINLNGVDLTEADLEGATLSGVNLAGVDATGANLNKAKLIEADLGGIILNNANLSKANLTKAYLELACLQKANLREADLTDANLKGADLTGSLCTEDQFATVKCLKYATMPNGQRFEEWKPSHGEE